MSAKRVHRKFLKRDRTKNEPAQLRAILHEGTIIGQDKQTIHTLLDQNQILTQQISDVSPALFTFSGPTLTPSLSEAGIQQPQTGSRFQVSLTSSVVSFN